LYEAGLTGLADLKILFGILLLLGNITPILIYLAALVVMTLLTAWIIKRKTSFPYITLLTLTYYGMMGVQYLMGAIK
jgi:uncharacterized membrane protein YphA (DoxX/SURF4 family)